MKSQIRPPERIVYTSRFSTGKPNPCNDHIYHSYASESLNLIFFNLKGAKRKGLIITYIFVQGVNHPTPREQLHDRLKACVTPVGLGALGRRNTKGTHEYGIYISLYQPMLGYFNLYSSLLIYISLDECMHLLVHISSLLSPMLVLISPY